MNLFFKIGAGVLSTLAITAGIVTAIPASRNFILNSVAPYSEVYQQKEQENKELQEAYISNLVLLAETRTSLLNAEFKAISYQNEIGVLRNTLSSTQENLTETISQKTYIEFSLNEANKNLAQITNELASLRQDFYELNSQMDSLIENDADQQEILALQQQIDELSQEIEEARLEILKLNQKRLCNKCGAEKEKGAAFCPKCGEKQTQEETAKEEALEKLENGEVAPGKEKEAEYVKEDLKEEIKDDNENKKE